MTDWGMSGRRDEFSFHLVDPFTLDETGETVEVVEGESSITWSKDADSLVTASIALANATSKDKLIRVKHAITLPDGTQFGETLGTFFVDSSDADAKFGLVDRTASCYSTLVRFTQDTLARDFARSAGYNIVDEVRELVEADGGLLRVLDGVDEARTHTVDIWFEIGTNRAEVLNTIAGWTSCELGVDENGFVTWGPYRSQSDKAVSYTFEDGSNCTYVAGFSISDTRPDAVNRVVAHFSRDSKPQHAVKNDDGSYQKDSDGNTVYEDDDPYPLADSVWVDLPWNNQFSYEKIGRRKTYDMTCEPCSTDDLTSQAQRYLDEHCGAVEDYIIEHVGIPGLRIGDKVRYVNPNDASKPLDLEMEVTEIEMSLSPLCMCKTKLELVVA